MVIAGGVAANGYLRGRMQAMLTAAGVALSLPPPALCTDNGAMVAWAGLERFRLGHTDSLATAPRPRWPLTEVRAPGG